MFEDFKPPNDNQRKYLSGLFGLGCVAWFTPVYNYLTNLHLHTLNFSLEYSLYVIASFFAATIFFILGFSILRATKN